MTDAMAAYLSADAACRTHFPTYQAAQDAYRSMKIGDAEYLAIRKEHDALMAVFDAAYAAVQDEPEEITEAPTLNDHQPDLFA